MQRLLSNKLKNDNKGSTILMVLICISFISILSVVLLSLTLVNAQTKKINRESKANFYSVEQALDEIYQNLGKDVMLFLESAYAKVLSEAVIMSGMDGFLRKSPSTLTAECMSNFKENFVNVYPASNSEEHKNQIVDKLSSFVIGYDDTKFSISFTEIETSLSTIRINGLNISYLENDYEDTITTDIVIHIPQLTFLGQRSHSIQQYPIVAKGGLIVNMGVKANISGDLFAFGKGIQMDKYKSELKISNIEDKSNKIVVWGDIVCKSDNTLTIKSNDPLQYDKLDIWCNNIHTKEGDAVGTARIEMLGRMYVKDDLELNIKSNSRNKDLEKLSAVKLEGEYFGYSYNHNSLGVEDDTTVYKDNESSAILVNGIKSELDMSELDILWISGVAYVDVNYADGDTREVVTAESVAIKGNQDLYLVPANSIKLKDDLFENYVVSVGNPVKRGSTIKVDFTSDFRNSIINNFNVTNFEDIISGYTIKHGNYENGISLSYIYLTFKNQLAASKYFLYKNQSISLNSRMLKNFVDVNISLPDVVDIYTTGIVSSVSEVDGNVDIHSYQPSAHVLSESSKFSKETELINQFEAFKNIEQYYKDIDKIDDELIIVEYADGSVVKSLESENDSPINNFTDAKRIVIITENDLLCTPGSWWNYLCTQIPNNIEALIVSKGNIEFKFNHSKTIKGIVYSDKEITMVDNSNEITLVGDNGTLKNILNQYGLEKYKTNAISYNRMIYEIFDGFLMDTDGPLPSTDSYTYKDLIKYENWQKK